MSSLKLEKEHKCHEGYVRYFSHDSLATKTKMRFSAFIPKQALDKSVPVIYWLSGLTCTEENFTTKACAQVHAAKHGVIIVAPDTSPRGAGVPGEDDSYDIGTGAGFYVNATKDPWRHNYQMYAYVVTELPELVEAHLPVAKDKRSIMGHSMGGHGAMVVALRNADRYRSVSALAPLCAPSQTPWGQKAFTTYLGDDEKSRELWLQYDTTALVTSGTATRKIPLFIDQGSKDDAYEAGRLRPDLLEAACRLVDHPLSLRYQDGYDHSYYFIQTFIGEHLAYHARALGLD
jgi:S-formylglutathione hydrolase